LIKFKEKWGFKLISIASLIEYRHKRDQLIEKISESDFPCRAGQFRLHVFRSVLDGRMHYALTLGDKPNNSTSLVRVQSANVLTDALGLIEKGNDSNGIDKALEMIAENGSGTLLYMESRKLDFADKKSGADSRQASHTPKMDFRDYGIGAQILVALGIKKIRLLSRDRRKVVGLEGYGLEIIEHILLH
jgi:3,4-dihydroxy 2-butanone 4-phosphate synthase/GTP cyclohydrolase II